MQDDNSQEKKYMEIILRKISEKLQLNNSKHWQQRDFENVSLLIEEKTGISLSVSTLKRISKNQFQKVPQKNTLNALAQFLEYKDWYDFKINNPIKLEEKEKKEMVKKKPKFNKKLVYPPILFVMVFFILLLISNSRPDQSFSEATFSCRKNVSEGVPNTVIFDYDISMYDFDSAFIQQSWDIRRRDEIKKNEKYSTSVYYYPGFHRAKLIINNQLVKVIPVYITTAGWLNLIQNASNNLIPVYVKENCVSDGQLYISPEKVEGYNIDLSDNKYSTCFYYVNGDFHGDSDNFIFETRIKNNRDEGGLVCQTCEVSIFGEYGRHFVQLCNPGCIGSLFLKFGSRYISGKNNDLSAFGTNLSTWNDLKLEIKNKLATVYLNGKEIYKTPYEESNGTIKGVFFRFAGCGAIDYSRLFDANENLVFSEDFE